MSRVRADYFHIFHFSLAFRSFYCCYGTSPLGQSRERGCLRLKENRQPGQRNSNSLHNIDNIRLPPPFLFIASSVKCKCVVFRTILFNVRQRKLLPSFYYNSRFVDFIVGNRASFATQQRIPVPARPGPVSIAIHSKPYLIILSDPEKWILRGVIMAKKATVTVQISILLGMIMKVMLERLCKMMILY